MRAERLQALGALRLLKDMDLEPPLLAALMEQMLAPCERPDSGNDLNGAQATAVWADAWRPRAGGGRPP